MSKPDETNNVIAVVDPWKVAMSKAVMRIAEVTARHDYTAFEDIDLTPIREMAKLKP